VISNVVPPSPATFTSHDTWVPTSVHSGALPPPVTKWPLCAWAGAAQKTRARTPNIVAVTIRRMASLPFCRHHVLGTRCLTTAFCVESAALFVIGELACAQFDAAGMGQIRSEWQQILRQVGASDRRVALNDHADAAVPEGRGRGTTNTCFRPTTCAQPARGRSLLPDQAVTVRD
jgi:hypothetical protein